MKSKEEQLEREICDIMRANPGCTTPEMIEALDLDVSKDDILKVVRQMKKKKYLKNETVFDMHELGYPEASYCLIKVQSVNAETWEMDMEEDFTFFSLERTLNKVVSNEIDTQVSYLGKVYGKSHSYIESDLEHFLGSPAGQKVKSIEIIPIRYPLHERNGQSLSILPEDSMLTPEHFEALNYE